MSRPVRPPHPRRPSLASPSRSAVDWDDLEDDAVAEEGARAPADGLVDEAELGDSPTEGADPAESTGELGDEDHRVGSADDTAGDTVGDTVGDTEDDAEDEDVEDAPTEGSVGGGLQDELTELDDGPQGGAGEDPLLEDAAVSPEPEGRLAWSALEDEAARPALRAVDSRVLVGYEEVVGLPELGGADVVARCDTGEATSTLYAEVEAGGLRLQGHRLPVALEPAVSAEVGVVLVTSVSMGGRVERVRLRVIPVEEPGVEALVVLGRDALGPAWIVDAGRRFIHRR